MGGEHPGSPYRGAHPGALTPLPGLSADERGKDHLRAGKLNLVDLAGSERQSKTGATGERLKEATKIDPRRAWTSSTREQVRKAESQVLPDPLYLNLHFFFLRLHFNTIPVLCMNAEV